jgi:hypothetical protein
MESHQLRRTYKLIKMMNQNNKLSLILNRILEHKEGSQVKLQI